MDLDDTELFYTLFQKERLSEKKLRTLRAEWQNYIGEHPGDKKSLDYSLRIKTIDTYLNGMEK